MKRGVALDRGYARSIPFRMAQRSSACGLRSSSRSFPLMGNEFAIAADVWHSPWQKYLQIMAAARAAEPGRRGVFPVSEIRKPMNGTQVGLILGKPQRSPQTRSRKAKTAKLAGVATDGRHREVGFSKRWISVFINHTKREASRFGRRSSQWRRRRERSRCPGIRARRSLLLRCARP